MEFSKSGQSNNQIFSFKFYMRFCRRNSQSEEDFGQTLAAKDSDGQTFSHHFGTLQKAFHLLQVHIIF
jgi:hypothetical protein